jgi:hypothetical protein
MTAINSKPELTAAVACIVIKILISLSSGLLWNTQKKTVHTNITLLKTWSFSQWMIPPAKKAHPMTNSIMDNMEPSSDCCTARIIPFFKAYIAIIISVAFPNVAFRRPPTAVQGRQE